MSLEAWPHVPNPPLPETGPYAESHKRINAIRREIAVMERTRDIVIVAVGQRFDEFCADLQKQEDAVRAQIEAEVAAIRAELEAKGVP
jgi:hypothetical protein